MLCLLCVQTTTQAPKKLEEAIADDRMVLEHFQTFLRPLEPRCGFLAVPVRRLAALPVFWACCLAIFGRSLARPTCEVHQSAWSAFSAQRRLYACCALLPTHLQEQRPARNDPRAHRHAAHAPQSDERAGA